MYSTLTGRSEDIEEAKVLAQEMVGITYPLHFDHMQHWRDVVAVLFMEAQHPHSSTGASSVLSAVEGFKNSEWY